MKIFIFIIGFILTSFGAHAELYKWTDKNGKVHFSDKVPDRNNVETISSDINKRNKIEVSKNDILGEWEGKSGSLVAVLVISENGRFRGVVKENDKVVWRYSGEWLLKENQLTWNYRKSIPPLPSEMMNMPDINRILSFNNNTLVLKESSGKITRYRKKI